MLALTSRLGISTVLAAALISPSALGLPAPVAAATPSTATVSETSRATAMAMRYLRYSPFSKQGLIDQLIYEGFSRSTATTAVNALKVNWNQQAVAKGRQYLKYTPMSQARLLDQLRYEGFTESEVGYARRHLYPAKKKPAKPRGTTSNPESRTPFSKSMDICDGFSGSGRALIVTKGTSCTFASNISEGYAKLLIRRPSARRATARFSAYSPVTNKSYPVKCNPLRLYKDTNGWRYQELTCWSGKNYRAKVEETVRIYS